MLLCGDPGGGSLGFGGCEGGIGGGAGLWDCGGGWNELKNPAPIGA